jgi:hypothetical protein
MGREWIDEGLRREQGREELWRLAGERRLRQTAAIEKEAPALMRQLVGEVAAAVEEYKVKTRLEDDVINYETLPQEGFWVTRDGNVRVALECRPAYGAHCVYCNMTCTVGRTETRELAFNLRFTVSDSGRVELSYESRVFHSLDEAVEFLMKPVLFPSVDLSGPGFSDLYLPTR